ncbi:hypothetical protein Bca52824_038544 [Brassica carinata]|uniref:ATP-dependent Clp protease proteolytic subunit n=1 Tax=Brassica carinata TaxID=52824 RepID=A0A8X7RPH6_BRACI|nr:hypothetical protein Bca52824_038544 [Brassica carinata]
MAGLTISPPLSLYFSSRTRNSKPTSYDLSHNQRNLTKRIVSALPSPYVDSLKAGLSSNFSTKIGNKDHHSIDQRSLSLFMYLPLFVSLTIKPKVGTVAFGVAASQGALLLAGGEKGMRYAMPNTRVMIHQPQTGCGVCLFHSPCYYKLFHGHVEDVRRQVNEAIEARQQKIDRMHAAFTGQPLETLQQYTERDRFLSASEALEFGLIDGLLETEY